MYHFRYKVGLNQHLKNTNVHFTYIKRFFFTLIPSKALRLI